MLQQHVDDGADVTVGCLEVPRMERQRFGVMHIDEDDRIIDFLEKPKDPPGMPGKPDVALASMGIYVFDTKFLFEELRRDAADPESSRDFGKDIIPYLVKHGKAVAHHSQPVACVRAASEQRIGAMSERSTPIGRPISTSPTWCPNSTCTTATGRSGRTRDHAARPSSCTIWMGAAARDHLAGLGGLRRVRRARCAARCCSPACASTPMRPWRRRS